MANWEKLNKEFDDALDSMTSEDWDLLASKRIKQTTRTMKEKGKEQIVYTEFEVLQLLLKFYQTESFNSLYEWFQQNKKQQEQ